MPLARDEDNKDWLIELMEEAGYHPDPGGMCFGVANMGMQAILAQDFQTLSNRYDKLIEIYDNLDGHLQALEMFEAEAQKPPQVLAESTKSVLRDMYNLKEELPKLRKKWSDDLLLTDKIDFRQLKVKLKEKEETFLYDLFSKHEIKKCNEELDYLHEILTDPEEDFLAFFEGVEVHQQPGKHSPLFEKGVPLKQNTMLTAPVALSKKLSESGGIQRVGDRFVGAYNIDELMQYFISLQKELDGIEKPIALILGSGDHAITVGYDPSLKQWLFVNSGCKPERIPKDNLEELTAKILHAFSKGTECAFTTNIYCNAANVEEFTKRVTAWKANPEFIKIHTIDKEKVNRSGGQLLLLAADDDDPELTHRIIQAGLNPDNVEDENGYTPMITAICNNHIHVVKEILAFPNRLSMSLNVNLNSLYQFARNMHIEEQCIDELIKKKFDVDKPIDPAATMSLSFHELATTLGYQEIYNLLEQYEKDHSKKTNSDKYLFFKSEGHPKRTEIDSSKIEEESISPNPFDK